MTGAAIYLTTRIAKNRFVRSVMRLRQPRYIAGAILAGIYFWSFLFRHGASRNFAPAAPAHMVEPFMVIVCVIALLILIGAWALPGHAPGLVFSEAEIQFLFPAPVTRRQLLAYKILRQQFQAIFSAFFFSLFMFRGSRFVGMWIVILVLEVYLTFVSFARARLKQFGIGWLWRLAAVAVIALAIGSVAVTQIRANSGLIAEAFQNPRNIAVVKTFDSVLRRPPLGAILYVPRIFAQALYGPTRSLLLSANAILVAMAFALFFLTGQLDVAFEEASIIASQRALVRRARMRGRRGGASATAVNRLPPLFRLGDRGRPEIAMIWKNLIGIVRLSSFPYIAGVLALVFAAAASIFGRHAGVGDLIGVMGLMATAAFAFIGPQAVRNDLRVDMLRLDVVKAFPLSAEALVASEIAAPLLVISAFEVLTLVVSVTVLRVFGHEFVRFATPELIICALVFVVPISAIQLLIQNAGVVLFPAWMLSADAVRGFTAIGQRMLMLLGNIVALAIALLPAAALFLPGVWLAHRFFAGHPVAIALATIPGVAVLVAEIAIAHKLLSAQFDELDVANDLDNVSGG